MRNASGKMTDGFERLDLAQARFEPDPFSQVRDLDDCADRVTGLVVARGRMHRDDEIGLVGTADQHPFAIDETASQRPPDAVVDGTGVVLWMDRQRGRRPQDIGGQAAEEPLGRGVPEAHRPIGLDRKGGHGRRVDERPEEARRVAQVSLRANAARQLGVSRVERLDPALTGAPDEPKGEGAEEPEPDDREEGFTQGVRGDADGEQQDRERRDDGCPGVDDQDRPAAHVGLDDPDGDEGDDDREGDADRVEGRGDDGLDPEQADRHREQDAVPVAIDGEQREDRGRDERCLERHGDDVVLGLPDREREDAHGQRGCAAGEDEPPDGGTFGGCWTARRLGRPTLVHARSLARRMLERRGYPNAVFVSSADQEHRHSPGGSGWVPQASKATAIEDRQPSSRSSSRHGG